MIFIYYLDRHIDLITSYFVGPTSNLASVDA